MEEPLGDLILLASLDFLDLDEMEEPGIRRNIRTRVERLRRSRATMSGGRAAFKPPAGRDRAARERIASYLVREQNRGLFVHMVMRGERLRGLYVRIW